METMSGLDGLGWPNPENEPKPETMNTRRTLLKNLGANLRHMMTEDWRNQDERNILGMAGHWLEKLGNDDQLDQTILRLGETQERMIDAERQRDEARNENIRLKMRLAKWIEWSRMHGHLAHDAGIVADTREILSENKQSREVGN
jgi:hypothetical protein